jgi:hypothetical protein
MANLGPKGIKWDADELRSLYEEQGLSLTKIGGLKGVSAQAVRYALSKFGIKRRPVGSGPVRRKEQSPFFKHGLNGNGYEYYRLGGEKFLGHRVLAARFLSRDLARNEVVHHCNNNKADNRPENLWVFPSQSAHITYHKTGVIHPDTIFLKDYE